MRRSPPTIRLGLRSGLPATGLEVDLLLNTEALSGLGQFEAHSRKVPVLTCLVRTKGRPRHAVGKYVKNEAACDGEQALVVEVAVRLAEDGGWEFATGTKSATGHQERQFPCTTTDHVWNCEVQGRCCRWVRGDAGVGED